MRAALLAASTLVAALAAAAGEPPAAVARADEHAGLFALEDGGCLVCHVPGDELAGRVRTVVAPRLERVGARVSPDWLRRFLADPEGTHPGTRMPDMMASWSGEMRSGAVESLVQFLASRGGPFDATPTAVFPSELEEGRQLFHEVGCVQCHAPEEPAARLEFTLLELEEDDADLPATVSSEDVPARRLVPLGDLAGKTSVDELAAFLVDPLAVRPSGRMPSLGLDAGEAGSIARYLLRAQATGGEDSFPGLTYEYFEGTFDEAEPDFDAREPVRLGATQRIELVEPRDDHFGFRFRGLLRVDEPGTYGFFTTSDDGSRLWVDGELVVSNTGFHGMTEESGTVRLEPGEHTLQVTMFEQGGDAGLEVRWQPPGGEKAEIPTERLSHRAASLAPPIGRFRLDPELVEEGERFFRLVGCTSCHDIGIEKLDARAPMEAPTLDELAGAGAGCLDDGVRPGRPRYGGGIDRAAALAAVNAPERLLENVAGEERVRETLVRFRCDGCHSRQGWSGPVASRLPYFFILGGHDLGDEGRIPPELDEPGTKLRLEWLRRVLDEGASVRPYMATRMPHFGPENLTGLAELLREVDRRPNDTDEPPFSLVAVEDGRRVTGTRGLGCINCHDFAGLPSLGVPAVDLAGLAERLNPDWFRRLLLDPIALNMNTRMPEFWVGGKSPVEGVLDGDPSAQIDAMWTYFSLGSAMPLPDGLVVPDAAYEFLPEEEPVVCGVFLKDVGPRALVVGFPELTHYAFDVGGSRLAKLWRGRFFNARGTWEGRAGQLEVPPSNDVIDLPPGPAFARLASPDVEWPANDGEHRPRPRARRYDAERVPSFVYALGGITITERIQPEITVSGTVMRREFTLESDAPVEDLWFRGLDGRRRIEFEEAGGAWRAAFREVVRW